LADVLHCVKIVLCGRYLSKRGGLSDIMLIFAPYRHLFIGDEPCMKIREFIDDERE